MKIFASELALAISLMTSDGTPPPSPERIETLVCMARNIYHEARGEPEAGRAAVAYVVLNRTEDPDFPRTPCAVIFDDGQFSWTDRATNAYPKEWEAYEDAMAMADAALDGTLSNPIGDATYFHAGKKRQSWTRGFEQVAVIGRHRFYSDDKNG